MTGHKWQNQRDSAYRIVFFIISRKGVRLKYTGDCVCVCAPWPIMLWKVEGQETTIKMFNSKVDHPEADSLGIRHGRVSLRS